MKTLLGRPQRSVSDWENLTPAQKVQRVTLRHEMPLRNFDITITFEDGSSEVLHAQARDILTAISVVSVRPSRAWAPARLDAITGIEWAVG